MSDWKPALDEKTPAEELQGHVASCSKALRECKKGSPLYKSVRELLAKLKSQYKEMKNADGV